MARIDIVAEMRDLVSRPAGAATARLQALEAELQDLDRQYKNGELSAFRYAKALKKLGRETDLAGVNNKRFQRQLKRHTDQLGRNRRKGLRGILDKVTGAFGDVFKSVGSLAKLLPTLKLPVLGAAFSVLIPIITAVGGGVMALVGHFGPMVTLVAGLPALLLGAISTIGVFALALGGMSEAVQTLTNPDATLEEINAAFAGKTPAFKDFAVVVAALKTPFQSLRDSIQESLLPELGGMVEKVSGTYLPFFQTQLSELGDTLGDLATRFGDLATSASWMKDMEVIWDNNRHVVDEFGGAIIHIISALRGVMVAFGPTMNEISDAFHRVTAQFDAFANSAGGRADMASMFERGWQAAMDFWDIITNLGVALWNIANIGKDLGSSMAGGMVEATEKFKEWTKSAEGQERIKQFFTDIKETLKDLGELFAAIGKGFAEVGAGADDQGNAQSFLDGITAAIPGVFDFIGVLIQVAGIIGDIIGFLGPFVTFLLLMAGTFGRVFKAIGPVWTILRFLTVALAGLIGWPVTIFLLLVGAFVMLYEKSEKFRNAVDSLGRAFKDALGSVKRKVIDPIIDGVKDLIDWIKKIDFPELPGGFGDGKDDWGWGRKHGGPVIAGRTFQVGEAGRELFLGASGKTSLLGENGPLTTRFSEPGVVLSNPVTERLLGAGREGSLSASGHAPGSLPSPVTQAVSQGVTAAPMPTPARGGGSNDRPLLDLPPIHVDARGMERSEAAAMIADAIRQSRETAETNYGGKP